MKRLKTIVAGTMTLALTLGGGLWAHHYVNAAATAEQSQTRQQDQGGKLFAGKRGGAPGQDGFAIRGGFGISDELAALLGTTKDELATAIKSGKTLAAIAGEKGVTVDSIVSLLVKGESEQLDKQVADGKLTQEQADKRKAELTDNATKFVNGELGGKGGFPGGFPGGGKGGMHEGRGGFVFGASDELAALLGTTKDELATAIKSGKTLAAIAGEKGVTVDSIVSLLVKGESEQLSKQVTDGKLTQEQADKRKAELTDSVTKFVNGELGGKGGFPGGFPGGGKGGMHEGRGGFVFGASDELAALLGTTKDELATAIKSGKTLAAIAGEKGVAVDSVVSLLVKAHSEQLDKQVADGKLTQEQADKRKAELTDSVTKFVNGELGGKGGFPGGFPGGGKGGMHEGRGGFGISDELATLLGTTKDELATAIKSGKTLAVIAGEKGVAVDSVVSLLVKGQSEQLDKQVADGKLTQEQADKRKAELTDNATKFVNGELGGRVGFPGGGKGGPGGKGAAGDAGGSRGNGKAGTTGQAVTS